LKNAALISNPLAGIKSARRSHQIHEAVSILRDAGIQAAIQFTSRRGEGKYLARAAVSNGCELVIVCGGDGTINEVINGIAPAQTPLAILPSGTANIVARELGLPGRILKAARQLPAWQPLRISLGRAAWEESGIHRERYFIAVAGIGFDAHIISQLDVPMKHRVGVLAYGWEAVRQTFRYGFPSFKFSTGGVADSATFAVIQRSTRYAGWLEIAPSQGIRSPGFSCCLFKSSDRIRYFRYAIGVLTRTHPRLSDVRLLSGSCVRCTIENPEEAVYFELDGEMAGRIPVTFDIIPDALTLLVPRAFIASVPGA
jgi:diacylglycerol kinase (ATP)